MDREDRDIFHEGISKGMFLCSYWNNSVDIRDLQGGFGWICYSGSVSWGFVTVYFIVGCIGLFGDYTWHRRTS